MELKYQQKLNNEISIARNTINTSPIVIDYSSFYKYNQPSAFSLLELQVQIDHSNSTKYIADSSIQNDNMLVTDKVGGFGNKYYYQYQPKFDCLNPSNIKVLDGSGKNVDYILEFGYLNKYTTYPSGSDVLYPLSTNKTIMSESFDSSILNGTIVDKPVYQNLSVFPNLPFMIFGAGMEQGEVYYTGDIFPASGSLSMFVLLKDVSPSGGYDTDVWSIGTDYIKARESSGTYHIDYCVANTSGTIPVSGSAWYRFDYDFAGNTSTFKVQDIANDVFVSGIPFSNSMFYGLDSSDKFRVSAYNTVCFDMALFDTAPNIGRTNPLFVYRYSKSLSWKTTNTYGNAPYRLRLLFQDTTPANLVYDALDENGNLLQNLNEEINHVLVYKQFTNTVYEDWAYVNPRVVLQGYLDSLKVEGDKLYVLPMSDTNVSVFYDLTDRKIHVSNGAFRSDIYGSGNSDVYYIPEYNHIPFASDDQTAFKPYYLRVVKERANLLSPYRIQINPFFIYEGEYPTYEIPNSYEVNRYYDANNDIHLTRTEPVLNYRNARGINIYKNGVLLDNDKIINYNMGKGYIDYKEKFSADDVIEVTYIKVMPDFILTYPSINSLLESAKNFRLYIRPYYDNYSVITPNDHQEERLCYRVMEDGSPVGDYYSCLTNMSISSLPVDLTRVIKIADVSVMTDLNFEDTRTRGGGIVPEIKFSYSKWPAFADIGYGVDGKVLFQSMIFIQIPSSVKDNLKDKYFFGIEADAIMYIKESIEDYIGSGVFYILLDENKALWPDPYPSSINFKR